MAARSSTAFLYVMGTGDGPSKIGHSLSPARRVKDIRRAMGNAGIVITGTWPVGYGIALSAERYVHWQLRDKHIRSEWFNATREEMEAAIAKALERVAEFDRNNPIPPLDAPGKALRFGEHIATKYPAGTHDRISAVLGDGEVQAEFIREAVEIELDRRERARKPTPPRSPSTPAR